MTDTAKKIRKKDKPNSRYLTELLQSVEPWSDDMTHAEFKKKPTRMFQAESYQAAADEFTEWLLKPHGLSISDLPVAIGEIKFDRMTLPYRTDTRPGWGFLAMPRILDEFEPYMIPVVARGRQLGYACFSDNVHIPRLTHPFCSSPWMSYTFSEVLSLRPGVKRAKGNVMIGGLGMGWMAREVLRRPGVNNVTIVERDTHIAAFFGMALKAEFGSRVEIVCCDAFHFAREHGHRFDRILMDIWHDYGNQDDRRWRELVTVFADTKTKLWQWA